MKRLALIPCLSILFLVFVLPFANASIMATLTPNLTCTSNCSAFNGVDVVMRVGVCVAVSSAGSVGDLTVNLKKGSTDPTGTFTVSARIYSVTGSPGANNCVINALLGTSPVVKDYPSLTTSFVSYAFTFSGVTLTNGQNVFVEFTYTIVGTCTTTCQIITPYNLSIDAAQSSMDNFPTGTGQPGAPNNAGDNTLCDTQDFCPSYTLNSGGSPPPNPPPTPSATASGIMGGVLALIVMTMIVASYEHPQNAPKVIKYGTVAVIAIGLIFIVFVAVGL